MNSKNRFILTNLVAFEFVLLNVVLLTYVYFRLPEFSLENTHVMNDMIPLVIMYNICWLFIILYIRDKAFYFNPDYSYWKNISTSMFFFVGIVATMVIPLKMRYFARSTFIFPIFIFSFLDFISHKYLLKYLKGKSSLLYSNTLLIGSVNEVPNLIKFSNILARYGYKLKGYLVDHGEDTKNDLNMQVFGKLCDLQDVLTTNSIDEVFIAITALERAKITKAIEIADNFGVRVKLIPENPRLLAGHYKVDIMGGLAIFNLRQSPLDSFNTTIIKRLFDFSFALLTIIVLFPVYLLIGIFIYLDSKGPIIYAPSRKGEAGKTFKCYKFRTMYDCDNPLNGTESTIANDPRITRIGKFLRKSDLDELPQFFNVLKGDMSVIGPRPHRIHLHSDFRRSVNDYMVRSYFKPGITGWAQVNGWRGPTATKEQKDERTKHDLWYIENWSFWLDIKIIFLTLFGRHHNKAF